MRVVELLILYALVGGGFAIAVSLKGHPAREAALLVGLWPLYAPFLVLAENGGVPRAPVGVGVAAEHETAFLEALKRAEGTPLASLLPEPEAARALAKRLRLAELRVAEIDALLARPEHSEGEIRARRSALEARGASPRALASVELRLANVARLKTLRERFSSELDEVCELLAQVASQAEVVRLAGALDPDSEQLVRELVYRVEGLDELLSGA